MSEKKGTGWGIGIAALYGGFALFIIIIVIFASFQHFEMAEDNYYDKELAYQKRIDKIRNAANLEEAVAVTYDQSRGGVLVIFPESINADSVSGTIHLYRPSNANLDREVTIGLDSDGEQLIVFDRVVRGLWEIRVDWTYQNIPYFVNHDIFVQ